MNLVFTTIPIRSEPTSFPPVGVTSLMDILIKSGYNPTLYDIDGLRPSFDKIINFFDKEKPDILGISAVISTTYRYVKELSHAVKRVSPKTKIILGGCLAASAEILLRKCPIDICVVGEGEHILLNLVKHWERFNDLDPSRKELWEIKGIAFIDVKDDFMFTGYDKQFLPEELPQPNYDLLARYSDISRYIRDPLAVRGFMHDKRSYEPHRKGQKCCFVMTTKGCVSRCTFCHRWMKGYRSYPIDNIIDAMKALKEKYNVGFFNIGDESFGGDLRMLDKFIEKVRPLDILFQIGGIRISTVYRYPEVVRKLKEVGCVEMIFGMESGSDKILTIMEKAVNRRQNLEVAKLLLKEGMFTIHQLVVGMPGENDETIKETIECIKVATEAVDDRPVISTNYFLALPGTPGYEFMRSRGLIGKTLDEEESYLLNISNTEAGFPTHYRNVSEESISKVFLWPHRIRTEATIHWYKHHRWKSPKNTRGISSLESPESGLIRVWHSLTTKRFYFHLVSLLGEPFWFILHVVMRIHIYGLWKALLFTLGIKHEDDRSAFIIKEPKSLRKLVTYPDPKELSVSEANMLPLRMGQ